MFSFFLNLSSWNIKTRNSFFCFFFNLHLFMSFFLSCCITLFSKITILMVCHIHWSGQEIWKKKFKRIRNASFLHEIIWNLSQIDQSCDFIWNWKCFKSVPLSLCFWKLKKINLSNLKMLQIHTLGTGIWRKMSI